MKRSPWRLVVGIILLGGVFNSLHNPHPNQTHDVFIWFLGFNILLVCIALWLVISFFSDRIKTLAQKGPLISNGPKRPPAPI